MNLKPFRSRRILRIRTTLMKRKTLAALLSFGTALAGCPWAHPASCWLEASESSKPARRIGTVQSMSWSLFFKDFQNSVKTKTEFRKIRTSAESRQYPKSWIIENGILLFSFLILKPLATLQKWLAIEENTNTDANQYFSFHLAILFDFTISNGSRLF